MNGLENKHRELAFDIQGKGESREGREKRRGIVIIILAAF